MRSHVSVVTRDYGGKIWEQDALWRVATVARLSLSPFIRISEMGPADVGSQVISVATPAVMPLYELRVKGFWAAASTANAPTRRVDVKRMM